jgi:hypothetical protein
MRRLGKMCRFVKRAFLLSFRELRVSPSYGSNKGAGSHETEACIKKQDFIDKI